MSRAQVSKMALVQFVVALPPVQFNLKFMLTQVIVHALRLH
jgi:hypothetical protein